MKQLLRFFATCLMIAVVGASLVGCGPCRVRVNTSTLVDPCKLPCGFPLESTFKIVSCSQEDPLLDNEMARKIQRYLASCGYYATTCEEGLYRLQFSYQSCCQDRLVNVPCYVSPPLCCGYGTSCYGPYGFYETYYPGTVVFAPQQVTIFVSYLQVSVLDGCGALVWEGCASVGGCPGSDIRCAMDYLVLGAFSYFGISSGNRRCMQIDPCSPQVQFLRY